MYPTEVTEHCRKDLTDAGVTELRTPAEVDDAVNKGGTTLVVINSVCGCAAGNARLPTTISGARKERLRIEGSQRAGSLKKVRIRS